jgi:FkbM family methyltransferase
MYHQFADRQLLRANRDLLINPEAFYASLLLKAVPGLYRRPIRLRFRNPRHTIRVESFMTAFVYREIFADTDYDLPLNASRPAILDVGANTGLFALRMKQLYPAAQVVCFEPESANFSRLETLIADNDLSGVTAVKKGIGAEAKTAYLYLHPQNIGGHSIIRQGADWTPVSIELITMTDALAMLPDGHCDLLKLDCEGAEYSILRSLTPELAERISHIAFEASGQLYNVQELQSYVRGLGYHIELRHGLTVAHRG